MTFEKKQVNRAVDELTECLNNILTAAREQYPIRIKQLFLTVNGNEVLNFIFYPYLNLELGDKVGFIPTRNPMYCDFVIPENEDEEIALILMILKYFCECENETKIDGYLYSIIKQSSFNDNLSLFNSKIVEPAFKKLMRKMRYKLEDINAIQKDKIEEHEITIINIGNIHANQSQIAVGKDIIQQSENIFDKIKNKIKDNIENENDRNELLSYVTEMEKNKTNKEVFRNHYDKFISRLGIYMSIFGPLLPYLVDYFK